MKTTFLIIADGVAISAVCKIAPHKLEAANKKPIWLKIIAPIIIITEFISIPPAERDPIKENAIIITAILLQKFVAINTATHITIAKVILLNPPNTGASKPLF